jgi:hypothetical protein
MLKIFTFSKWLCKENYTVYYKSNSAPEKCPKIVKETFTAESIVNMFLEHITQQFFQVQAQRQKRNDSSTHNTTHA